MTTVASSSGSAIHRYFEVSLFLLVTVAFLALASTGKIDLATTLVVAGALGAKALRYRRHRGPELSHLTATILTLFCFAFLPVDTYLVSGEFPVALAHLVLFIAVARIFSVRTNRDYLWLALVAFGGILVAAILTVDTTFLAFFFLFLLVGISTFISYEIKRGTETARSALLAAGSPTGRRLERSLLVTSLTITLGTLVLATGLFFFLPRFATGYLSAYAFQPTHISGFSDEVTLGDIGSILRNHAVVMRVRVEEGDPQQLEGLKWRGIALARFDGHRWYTLARPPRILTATSDGRVDLPVDGLRTPESLRPPPRRRTRYRILLEPITSNTLFAAAVPLEMRGRFRVIGLDDTGSLINLRSSYAQLGYEVTSDIKPVSPAQLRALPTDYPPEIREQYLQLPPLDPRIEPLARQVTAGADNPYDKARELERYLRTGFGYTLDLPSTPEDDPIASFLFERRQGHCEYFAATMTVLLRTQGIPARMVNGFQTGEYNEVGENYIVRASDAHSWVEVFFPRVGWVEFDPTPPDPNAPVLTWWTTLQHYSDAFAMWWEEWVINYDEMHQWRLARNVRTTLSSTADARYWFRRQRRRLTSQIQLVGRRILSSPYTLPVGVGLFLLVLWVLRGRAISHWVRGLWLIRRGRTRTLSAAEVTLVYERLLARLRRKGYQRVPSQTPLEFAASLPPPELATTVWEFTRLYNHARFGQQSAAPGRLLELLRRVENWKPGH